MSKKMQDYDEFIEKFKPKHTTDDCYTPPLVYDAVLGWAREHLDIGDRPVVRPFYPGGDYEHYDYPKDCVVIDNPPFSIFARICNFYMEHSIPFLLFAPAMISIRPNYCYIGVSCGIIYENGANVNTAFVTNMLDDVCVTAPELLKRVNEAVKEAAKGQKKTLAKLSYPDCVLRASELQNMSLAGIHFQVEKGTGIVARGSTTNKKEFGNSILLSTKKTAEKLAAEKLAAEKLAAEKLELTEVAKRVVEELDKGNDVYAFSDINP